VDVVRQDKIKDCEVGVVTQLQVCRKAAELGSEWGSSTPFFNPRPFFSEGRGFFSLPLPGDKKNSTWIQDNNKSQQSECDTE
jgi:hypothetical protein